MEQLRIRTLILSLLCIGFLACEKPNEDPLPSNDPVLTAACNYIKGGGSAATGGEGGSIFYVDRLDDVVDPSTGKAEDGTLRYAVEAGGPRVVLFRVAGTIHLNKELIISKGNITIAGQSAPGQGICIADYPLVIKNTDNVIVRFLHVRLGNESLKKDASEDFDAVSVNNCTNVVLDHLSCSWSVDECVSCYGNTDFTCQYCFVTESLRDAGHIKGAHGYGGIWGGQNVSFHHNLLAHHDSRNPRFDHDYVSSLTGPIDYINNVVYNWGGNSTYGGEGVSSGRKVNFIGNYYKAGPSTKSTITYRLCNPTTSCSTCGGKVPMTMFLEGNYMYGSESVTSDNWSGVQPDDASKKDACKSASRFAFANAFTGEETAEAAYETVLTKAGCSLQRDALDERIVSDVRNGSGKLINLPSEAGGWPELTGDKPVDTDRDGMPDEWEEAHGLNPRSYADGKAKTLVSGHTNLEVYLCDIVKHLY